MRIESEELRVIVRTATLRAKVSTSTEYLVNNSQFSTLHSQLDIKFATLNTNIDFFWKFVKGL
ncbi:MAG: hypothetical protein FWH22_08375 [Fibromonadales bacterium]|nr:hypothetical protein [Fibromonadales bacterium]